MPNGTIQKTTLEAVCPINRAGTRMTDCLHHHIHCLNGYEYIRKYRCDDCDAVMMCACDEQIGLKHLPHQVSEGTELETHRRVPVTLGFIANVCEECRKQPITAYPRGVTHGHTSKLRRYYWREIYFERMKRFDAWNETRRHPPQSPEAMETMKTIEAEVIADMKQLHVTAPKYIYTTETDADFIKAHAVEQSDLKASYRKDPEGKKQSSSAPRDRARPRSSSQGITQRSAMKQCVSKAFPFTFYSERSCGL